MDQNRIYTKDYFLTAGESDAEGRMPLQLLVSRLIETASLHANSLGIGYEKLVSLNLAWVLSRVSIEIDNLPQLNESYRLETWIESTNRLFSERCFELIDKQGNTAAKARTTWAAIDITTRRPANPGVLGEVLFPENPRPCDVAAAGKLPAPGDNSTNEQYTFKYCDLDFNRHVNTIKYIDLILNHWSLEQFDHKSIARFDIAFHHECLFNETVTLKVDEIEESSVVEIYNESTKALSARIIWKNNNLIHK